MKTSAILNDVETTLKQQGVKSQDRFINRMWLNAELSELVGREPFEWACVHLDPIILCVDGQRAYDLPKNFPDNFIAYGIGHEAKRVVTIDDSTNKVNLNYVSPMEFYLKDLTAEQDGKPSDYTIVSKPDGRRQLILSPPPDDDYTIDGLYIPTDWQLDEESDLPPIPGNSLILKWGILRRYNANYQVFYQQSYSDLLVQSARNRKTQMKPSLTEV